MKRSIYPVPERTAKVSKETIKSIRESHYAPTFKILGENYTVTADACTVELFVQIQDDKFYITGSSRRAKDDASDFEVGYYVAVSRAYGKLARRLAKRAEGLVKTHDYIQEAAAARKAAPPVTQKAIAKRVAAAKKASSSARKHSARRYATAAPKKQATKRLPAQRLK